MKRPLYSIERGLTGIEEPLRYTLQHKHTPLLVWWFIITLMVVEGDVLGCGGDHYASTPSTTLL